MSVALLEQTKNDIHEAFQVNNLRKIEKETLYVYDRIVHFMLSAFKDRLKGITFETNGFDFDEAYNRTKKNMEMYRTLNFITQIKHSVSNFHFAKIKVDVER